VNWLSEEWKRIRPEKLFVVFGFLLMAISVFLPWITASAPILYGVSISRTGFELSPEIGWFALLFFAVSSLYVWFSGSFKKTGTVCLLMSIWMLFETLLAYLQLQDRVSSYSSDYLLVNINTGFYLLAVGDLVSLIGSLLVVRLKPAQLEAPVMVARICPQCGKPLEDEARFCPYCGKSLS
jgi:hypothetical protein